MSLKLVNKVLPMTRAHWVGDGFSVHSVFNQLAFTNDVSPFLLFDYAAPKVFEPSDKKRGVGQHGHRGIETVTIAYQGEVEHRDSKGHHGVIGPGDVQWMSAASGIVHEEFHSTNFTKKGGVFEMAQLWVNLPKKDKMAEPRYQGIINNDIPLVNLPGDSGDVRVIAGEYTGNKGSALTFSPINIWDVRLSAGKSAQLPLPHGHNTILFMRKGVMKVDAEHADAVVEVRHGQAAVLTQDGASLHLHNSGTEEALVLLLGGEPLNEPIFKKGNFVMNSEEEVNLAIQEYKEGTLGGGHFE